MANYASRPSCECEHKLTFTKRNINRTLFTHTHSKILSIINSLASWRKTNHESDESEGNSDEPKGTLKLSENREELCAD